MSVSVHFLPTLPFLLHRLVCGSLHGSNLCLLIAVPSSISQPVTGTTEWTGIAQQELDSALQHSAFARPHAITQLCGKQGFSSSHLDK